MSEDLNVLLSDLNGRLPELEWKIKSFSFSSSRLPRGLFSNNKELTSSLCIEEIKKDIQLLSTRAKDHSAHYLAQRIKQKIDVLVALCQIDSRKNKPQEKTYFGVNMLSTRQQWLHSLETDIQTLSVQQSALAKTLDNMSSSTHPEALLNLKAELGEVEKRLTLAQETLKQATK